MERVNDLKLFVEAATLGSFSAAARKMGCSPAAASACIVRLEASLKTRLFERTTRRLRLTDEGNLFFAYCQRALTEFNDIAERLQSVQDEVKGIVRISAPSDLGRNRLVSELDRFRQTFPTLYFVLSLSDSSADLIDDDIDIAIRYGQPADSAMTARKLANGHRVVCAAPSLLARIGRPAVPADLAAYPTIVLVNAAGRQDQWAYRDSRQEAHRAIVHPTHLSDDGEIVRKWAIMGYGLAYKSILDITDDINTGRLETVLSDYFVEPAPLYALYNRHRYQPPRIRRLLDFLAESFSQT